MADKHQHKVLKYRGVIGSYTDERGNRVIQFDDQIDNHQAKRASSRFGADKAERVPGGIVAQVNRTTRHRPVPTGVSISAQDVTAGTSGLLVMRDGEGPFIDTNLHVAGGKTIKDGEREDQPGEYDQTEEKQWSEGEEKIGELNWYIEPKAKLNPLSRVFSFVLNVRRQWGNKPRYTIQKRKVMKHDVAHIKPQNGEVERTILGVDTYPETIEAAPIGKTCKKAGRTTGITDMKKVADDWTGIVMEPWGPVRFEDQHLYKGIDGPGSKGGDSGSSILWDGWSKWDGRLFAGSRSKNITIANPMDHFKETYNVELYK